ncbi:MAG: phosphate/phosphite/phosphonate ABC transporter substrate-binding protein, partial [Nocardioidaceae bacterium]
HSVLVSQAGAGFEGPASLKGRRIALGSADSAQAAILPLHYLAEAGVAESDLKVIRINSDLGKHGDTGRSELDAIRMVLDGDADAAAIGNTTWQSIGRDELMPGALEAFWTTPRYSHCTFTVMDSTAAERTDPWVDRLLAMDWDVPEQRRIMELEGCERSWVPPNLAGYESLFAAVERQGVSARW